MEIFIKALCQAVKKLLTQLDSLNKPLAIILLIGQAKQGKSTLLRQSNLKHIPIDSAGEIEIYYNELGLYIELNETWFNQSPNNIHQLIKQINRCHRSYHISGLLYCVDIYNLLDSDHEQIGAILKNEQNTLNLIHQALGYRVNFSVVFTHIDAIAGFSEFYQNDHKSELDKPLGFSLPPVKNKAELIQHYRKKFEYFIESLNQQVISKIHPIRSGTKRTLIREYPLQLASLRVNIQSLLQTIPLHCFSVRALFFVSAEQGGMSKDRLTKKIQHEYALTIQNEYHQSVNYRPYFVNGAINAFQNQCQNETPPKVKPPAIYTYALMAVIGLTLGGIAFYHVHSSRLLDEVNKDLVIYESLSHDAINPMAIYHLSTATETLNKLPTDNLSMPRLSQFKKQFKQDTEHHLNQHFIPTLIRDVEQMMIASNTPPEKRYDALKVYLMLSNPGFFSRAFVLDWYKASYQTLSEEEMTKRIALLKQVIQEPFQPLAINPQNISDARNILKALPENYYYYVLAKRQLGYDTITVQVKDLKNSDINIPAYLTKSAFQTTLANIANTAELIKNEHWVLERPIPNNLPQMIEQAYYNEYVSWWQSFTKHIHPKTIQSYQEGYQHLEELLTTNAIPNLIQLLQEQTSPIFDKKNIIFNEQIASKFSEINLISLSSINRLTTHIEESKKFLNTLSVISDNGYTAYMLTLKRFNGDGLSNPISVLFNESEQLPEPLSSWTQQIASDIWYLLVSDTRKYINTQWQQEILPTYEQNIKDRFPFAKMGDTDISMEAFELFFSPDGQLNRFVNRYIKPFLDINQANWSLKELNNFQLPIKKETIKELMRANIITNMFFPLNNDQSSIGFSLQKINLDPVVDQFRLQLGEQVLVDSQITQSNVHFEWPVNHASLSIKSIDGEEYQLSEMGPWAFFKLLQKVNVIIDDEDSSALQILFEINGNSGRYYLKANHQLHPFIPGILNDFQLPRNIT